VERRLVGIQRTRHSGGAPGRIAIPVAADSDAARRRAMRLVDDTDFGPVGADTLADDWPRPRPTGTGLPAGSRHLTL